MGGFGGAVKLTGESEYRKALSQITQSLKLVSAEMKATASMYDAGDKSLKDLKKDSDMYKNVLEQNKTALANMKDQLSRMIAEYNKNVSAHDDLVDSYNKEKAKLDEIGRTLGTSSNEYKEQAQKVADLSTELSSSEKALDSEGKAINDLRIKTANAEATMESTTDAVDKLGDETEDSGKQADKSAKGGWTVFKGVLANLTTDVIKGALNGLKNLTGALVDMGKQAVSSYAEYEQLAGGLEAMFDSGGKEGQEALQKAMENTKNAWKDLTMSENEYMQSFASTYPLMKGDIDDVNEAIDTTHRLMTLNSDLANTFGYDMSTAQNAINWALKGNFTYLDNLNIGIKGTKEGFLETAKSVGYMVDSVDELTSSQILDILEKTADQFGVLGKTQEEALKTIQGSTKMTRASWQNLLTGMADDNADFYGLMGNFTDSLMAMLKNIMPRVKNFISGLAVVVGEMLRTLVPELIQMIPSLINDTLPILVETVDTGIREILKVLPTVLESLQSFLPTVLESFLNMIPLLIDTGGQLLMALITGISEKAPELTAMIPSLLLTLVQTITRNLGLLIQAGIDLLDSLLTGIIEALPELLSYLPYMLERICSSIMDNLDLILDAGIQLLLALIDGILEALPQLIEMLPDIIIQMVNKLLSMIPKIIEAGVQLLTSLVSNLPTIIQKICEALPRLILGIVNGILDNLPAIINAGITLFVSLVKELPTIIKLLLQAVGQIIMSLLKGLLEALPKMASVGLDLIKGLWNGIKNAGEWLWGKIKGFFKGITDKIKNFLGIHSPSKLFRDEIGENLALGLGEGFEDTMKDVSQDMQDSIPTSFDVNSTLNGTGSGGALDYYSMVNAFKEALGDMKIEMDDHEMGKFVDQTVSQLIYV
jgi:phage-related protein